MNCHELFCSQQIIIPPEFPDILKQFTKGAIRTQPKDVLRWSYEYFTAINSGLLPPVSERVRHPKASFKIDTGLTEGILSILNKQFSSHVVVKVQQIEEKWRLMKLPIELFQEICLLGNFFNKVEWFQFLALTATTLRENMGEALKLVCEILTDAPKGKPPGIGFGIWCVLYRYLARLQGNVSNDWIAQVLAYLSYDVSQQNGNIIPANFLHPQCPRLHPSTDNYPQ